VGDTRPDRRTTRTAPSTAAASAGRLPAAPGPHSATGPPAFAPNVLKLQAPRPLRQAVRRKDLVDSLLGETAPLVLFSAPAGSGKTATISQWLEVDRRTSGWLQLDAGDDDPVALLQYLVRALLALTPLDTKVLMWLALPEPPIRQAVLPAMLKAVSSAPPFILVLDDTHCVRDPRCWEILGMLVEAVSVGSAVVTSGRADPPLRLGRLRSRDLLAEYRFPRLCFDRKGAVALLALHGFEPEDPIVEALELATEGWPAGVYLAALAWKASDGPRPLPSGERREIADYLTSEVLAEQSADVVRFLTRTAIVSRLCPELCTVLTGREDSARLLEAIERENLFLIPLDDRRELYRYHHLFRELLEVELKRREPGLLPDLHRKAAEWLAARDEIDEALHHLLRAGLVEQAGDLVATAWWSRFATGRAWTARRWLDGFSPDEIRAQVDLRLAASWLLAMTGESKTARDLYVGLEPSELDSAPRPGAPSPATMAALVRAMLAPHGPHQMMEDARFAARLEEAGHSPWHAVALSLVGAGAWLSGDDEGAVEPFQQAILASEGLPGGADLAALGGLSLLAADHGEWEEARAYAEEAVRRTAPFEAGDYLPNSAARLARDRLMAREGDDDAVADLTDMLRSLDPDFCPWIPASVNLCLAEAFIDRGEILEARSQLDAARAVLRRWAPAPGLLRRAEALEARLRVRSSVEPISRAELRVLELLPTHLTTAEIAERLHLSPNTVGSHIKALHRKLDAGRRSEVVDKAVTAGLLQSPPEQ
jgi:LuxR family maltose regulon positive regulatory protein